MTSEYLKTLYQDFSTKINSINIYLKRISAEMGKVNQVEYQMISELKKKFETLEKFQKTRQRSVPTTPFSIEPGSGSSNQTVENADIKSLDAAISDMANELNYLFTKSKEDMNFLTQSHIDLQDLVNNIYDEFQSLYEKM